MGFSLVPDLEGKIQLLLDPLFTCFCLEVPASMLTYDTSLEGYFKDGSKAPRIMRIGLGAIENIKC